MKYYFCLYNAEAHEILYPWDGEFDLEKPEDARFFEARKDGFASQAYNEGAGWFAYVGEKPFDWSILEAKEATE